MVQNHIADTLSERLMHDVQIFDDLLKLIPAKFYVMDKAEEANGKFQYNKRKKAPKQAIKEATRKAKKAKLDPSNAKSITEVQEERAKQLAQDQSDAESADEDDDNEDGDKQEETEKMDVDSGTFSELDDSESVTTDSTTLQEPGKMLQER
ncbi:60S ribosome biogenesis protein Rrp14-domain-containing protein [Parasitella parasitica]|nr:60S ribosome biogenesis protein Rrp14-domain-containing protein [Parasitella parasitica]